MTMTVEDLLRELEDVDPNAEVRLATQPGWPFEYSIQGVYVVEASEDSEGEEGASNLNQVELHGDKLADEPAVVYLAEGSQLGYLPRWVRREVGW